MQNNRVLHCIPLVPKNTHFQQASFREELVVLAIHLGQNLVNAFVLIPVFSFPLLVPAILSPTYNNSNLLFIIR